MKPTETGNDPLGLDPEIRQAKAIAFALDCIFTPLERKESTHAVSTRLSGPLERPIPAPQTTAYEGEEEPASAVARHAGGRSRKHRPVSGNEDT